MRDLNQLRLFLLAAIGAAPAAACSTPAATPPAVVATDATSDSDASIGDAAGDLGPASDGGADAADATADTSGDSAAADAADSADSDSADPVDSADAADSADTADSADAVDVALCSGGAPQSQCYSAAALKAMIDNPPMGGDQQPQPYAGPLPPQGCPPRELVQNDCCNPAVAEGVLKDDTCCYSFCVGACCGRPLRIGGVARTADLQPGSAWAAASEAAPASPDPTALALAAAWRQDGREEHAAIASFQRLGLELLAVGAPPELVSAAGRAAIDEVGHAQQCFAWAQALDGAALGPAALALGDLQLRGDLPALAVASALEGGIGETLAAAELATAAALCADPQRAEALRRMADDEARHAALAWQVVAWAVGRDPEAVRPALQAALQAALAAPPAPFRRLSELAGVAAEAAHRAGRLTPAEAERCARAALAAVVAPCAQALLPDLGIAPPTLRDVDRAVDAAPVAT